MDAISEQRDAVVVIGLTAAGFILLVASTCFFDYGLILMPRDRLVWSLTRLVPGLGWISLALVLLLVRGAVIWSSAAAAFSVALIAGCTVAAAIAPTGLNPTSLLSSVVYYALISALLCLTIRNPILAGLAGPLLIVLQVLTDIAAHLGTGVLQIAC